MVTGVALCFATSGAPTGRAIMAFCLANFLPLPPQPPLEQDFVTLVN
jgi:hypothetical protein